MSLAHSVLKFFGVHLAEPSPTPRMLTLAHPTTHVEETAEVDNLRERYSAARYVEHLRGAMNGDFKGRGEWLNYVNGLAEDDYRLFIAEVDELVEAGALVHVLSPDEVLAARQRVLDKWDDYNAAQVGLMHDMGVDQALANRMVSTTHAASGDAFALNAIPEGAEAAAAEALEQMDDAEIEAWSTDEPEDADNEEGTNDEEEERYEEFEIEVGDEADEDAKGR